MDLFELNRQRELEKNAPLASRMRPESIGDYVGQKHLIGKDKPLYRMIKADRISSMILYGPPGTGKTTLAYIIAKTTHMNFKKISAVTSGVKEIRQVIKEAEDALGLYSQKTILFIDEIHRFNKSQQDALLPYVENGTIILIGATTENPYFEVNKALLSRSSILRLKKLDDEDLRQVLTRALEDEDKGFGSLDIEMDQEAEDYLILSSQGDARVLLNSLEIAVLSSDRKDGKIKIDLESIKNSIIKKAVYYDKDGDSHYDTISAFIKSMRGSDPDAALYYLARMLEAGEDIKFIARRIVIFASEDIGLADPNAMSVAIACFDSVNVIGLPEARIILSNAVVYMALAPKSNSTYKAIDRVQKFVRNNKNYAIPAHLKDSHYSGAREFGHGLDYEYPHDFKDHYVDQTYLPDPIRDEVFYEPGDIGLEKDLNDRLNKIKDERK